MWMLLNGAWVAEEQARVPILDRRFLYGDAAFDTLAAYDGRIFRVGPHLERLSQSLQVLRIEAPCTPDRMAADLYTVLERNQARDAILRICVSRGSDASGAATYSIACLPPKTVPADSSRSGVTLAMVSIRRTQQAALPGRARPANYLSSILALAEAIDQGADEALLLDSRGFIAECAYSNVFLVTDAGLFTPTLEAGVLPGITRAAVLQVAREHGVTVAETLVEPSTLADASEMFVTNTVGGVVPVRTAGQRWFRAPGPVTAQIARWYWTLVEREAGPRWTERSAASDEGA